MSAITKGPWTVHSKMRDCVTFPGIASWHTDEPMKSVERARDAIAKVTGAAQ